MITKKTLYIVLFASILMLALVFGPRAAQTTNALSLASVTVPYSGSLTDAAGQPVADGDYELTFTLYKSASGGEALWTEAQAGVTVQDGAFTVLLGRMNTLPTAALDSGARWLEIGVRGPGEASFTLLSPRQELNAAAPEAPAALSCAHNHWGETWSGSGVGLHLLSSNDTPLWAESSGGAAGVDGRNTTGAGIYGQSMSGVGVIGKTLATTGSTTGVWGEVGSGGDLTTYARGVVGWATKTTSTNYGVWGQSESSGGTGVYGQANASGCTPDITGYCYGVIGISNHGNGVLGTTNNGVAILAYASGSGDLIKAYSAGLGTDLRFRVSNTGNVTADGTFTSPAADLAEMLPAVKGLEPGDVLVIGEDGLLTRCTTAYQPTVVGVYSTKPGFLGGGSGNLTGKIPLAVIGVVPVKVSAENGPIRPGDLLVASSTPGYAMKAGANPPVGTVIGKALASLLDGTGVIQILVMLQ